MPFAVEFVGTSNKSECTRESTMPGACPAVSRTAHGGGETDFNHAKVRSTTQRHRPSPLPCFVLRMANRGKIWRVRSTPAVPRLAPQTVSTSLARTMRPVLQSVSAPAAVRELGSLHPEAIGAAVEETKPLTDVAASAFARLRRRARGLRSGRTLALCLCRVRSKVQAKRQAYG